MAMHWMYSKDEKPRLVSDEELARLDRKVWFDSPAFENATPSVPPAANAPTPDAVAKAKEEFPMVLHTKDGKHIEVKNSVEYAEKMKEGVYAESPAGPFKAEPEPEPVAVGADASDDAGDKKKKK